MPCFFVQKGYVLVDVLHLLVRGNPGPTLRAIVSKSDCRCAPCQRAPFFGPFCFHGGRKPSSSKLDFLLNSAHVLPTLCVKASAQKASRARLQKCIKNKAFFKMCMAGIELATARPKECKRFACPSNPPTIPAAFQDATSLEFKAPILNLYTIIVKLGLNF
jgi:hypothetical protein